MLIESVLCVVFVTSAWIMLINKTEPSILMELQTSRR